MVKSIFHTIILLQDVLNLRPPAQPSSASAEDSAGAPLVYCELLTVYRSAASSTRRAELHETDMAGAGWLGEKVPRIDNNVLNWNRNHVFFF